MEDNMNLVNLKKYSETNFNNDSQKIGLFIKGTQNNYPATAHIRLLQIFDSINKDDLFTACIIDFDEINLVKKDIDDFNFFMDTIIIQRDVLDFDFSRKLIEYCKLFSIKIIYEIDDDLLNIDQSHPEYEYYLKSAEIIKFIIENSNYVTVSTEKLKDKLLKYSNKIEVIQNTLVKVWDDDSLFSNKKNQNIIKIGYMGTITHENDIKIIENSIQNVKKYFKKRNLNVEFVMIGGTKKELSNTIRLNIPENSTVYPKFIKWLKETVDWNISIAPLEDNNINSSKSEIKYLEYTALGLPGIYSAVGAYKEIIKDGKNGILIYDNSEKSWTNTLIKLIEDTDLQKEILNNSINYVKQNYSMDIAVNKWKNILNTNKLNKNSILYSKIQEFKKMNTKLSFNEFLISESYNIIQESGLFDEEWYLNEYEDVKYNNLDPIYHYLKMGVKEYCKPNYNFEEFESDIFGLNPFVKFILFSEI